MKLIYASGRVARPGDVVRSNLDRQWVTIAGWELDTQLVLAWTRAEDIGLLDKVVTYSPHLLNLEWKS